MGEGQHTFLFADLAGFTALTEVHGDEFAANAAAEFRAGVRRLLPEYGADEVKTIGDAVMVHIPDPADAVRLGVRILDEVGQQHRALAVRVGVHTGTAVRRNGDWFGAGVNLSARVVSSAAPGEVLMTAATKAGAGTSLDRFELEGRGAHSFKNVSEPAELYALTLAAQAGQAQFPVDPVCRMAVDPARSSERRTCRDTEYHFCSGECAEVFDHDPARYTRPSL